MSAKKDAKADIKILNTVAVVMLGVAFYFQNWIPAYIGGGLVLITVLSEFVTHWIAFAWMKLGEGLGWVNSKILLGLIFFFFLTPIAFLYRLRSGDKMQLKKKKKEGSYFTERDHTFKPEDLEKMW